MTYSRGQADAYEDAITRAELAGHPELAADLRRQARERCGEEAGRFSGWPMREAQAGEDAA